MLTLATARCRGWKSTRHEAEGTAASARCDACWQGDDVAHLVGSFCRHYNLDDKCCQNLQALIDEQLVCIHLHGYTSPSETSVLESDDSSI